jgi:hypothetical protein
MLIFKFLLNNIVSITAILNCHWNFVKLPNFRCEVDNEMEVPSLFSSPWLYSPWRTLTAWHIEGSLSYLDIWQDSLDKWSARHKALYLHWTTQQKDADKYPCLERDSNPRSQQPTGQDPRLRPHGHCDGQFRHLAIYSVLYKRKIHRSVYFYSWLI